MATKWSDIIKSNQYTALDEQGKAALKDRYWKNVIETSDEYQKGGDDFRDALRSRFYGDAGKVPYESAPEPTRLQLAKQTLGETFGAEVPALGKAAEFFRSTAPQYIAQKGGEMGYPGTSAALATAVGTAGELIPKTGGELALQGLTGPALQGLGAAGGAALATRAGQVVKEAPVSIMSALTRIEKPIVERALTRGEQVIQKMRDIGNTDVFERGVRAIEGAVNSARREFGMRLGRVEDWVAEKVPGRIIETNAIGQKLEQKLANAGYKTPAKTASDVEIKLSSDVNEILDDFRNLSKAEGPEYSSILGPNGEQIVSVPASAAAPQKMSFKDALTLRRKIDDTVSFYKQGSMKAGVKVEALLKEARAELNQQLLNVSPTFKKFNDKFAEVARLYEQVSDDFLRSKNPEIVKRRVLNLFKKGTVERKAVEKLDKMSAAATSEMDGLLDALAAEQFSYVLNPKISRAAQNTGGALMPTLIGTVGTGFGAAIGGFGGAATAGLGLAGAGAAGLAATSPRLNLAAARAIGRNAKALAKPAYRNVLGTLLAAREKAARDQRK